MRRTTRGDRLGLESDLRRAVDRGEMRVAFQPIVRLEDRTIAGFEALLRWQHPKLGAIPPQTFIPIAEETGLIVDLGLFALERTANELAVWQRALDTIRPSSPPSTSRAASSCATISCRTSAPSCSGRACIRVRSSSS